MKPAKEDAIDKVRRGAKIEIYELPPNEKPKNHQLKIGDVIVSGRDYINRPTTYIVGEEILAKFYLFGLLYIPAPKCLDCGCILHKMVICEGLPRQGLDGKTYVTGKKYVSGLTCCVNCGYNEHDPYKVSFK